MWWEFRVRILSTMHERCSCIGCCLHTMIGVCRRRLSAPIRRRLVYGVWLVVCLECSAWVALSLWRGAWTTPATIRKEQEEVVAHAKRSPYALLRATFDSTRRELTPELMAQEVIHPYLGFVRKPRVEGGSGAYYGFEDAPGTWLESGEKDTVVIGIFGGSVAQRFYYGGRGELEKQLQRHPLFTGKRIVTKLLALPGYKQPQQLFTLNYYLSLGGRLDVAVNIDGVNELILPSYENTPKGVFPFYPRSWFFRIQPEERADLFPLIGQISYLTQKRSEWAQRFLHSPFSLSMTSAFVWRIGDVYLAAKLGRREALLVSVYAGEAEDYAVTGPIRHYTSREEELLDSVEHWKRSSVLMHAMSAARGIRYFHFLQPTGRLDGAKPLTEAEHAKVFLGEFPPTDIVNAGYPLLREAGRDLWKNGVRFTDISRVFHNVRRPIYTDCCHVEIEGSEIMARAIADVILREFR